MLSKAAASSGAAASDVKDPSHVWCTYCKQDVFSTDATVLRFNKERWPVSFICKPCSKTRKELSV